MVPKLLHFPHFIESQCDLRIEPNCNDVTATQLAVDRQIEHRTVTHPALMIQPEPDSPDLLRFQRAFGANLSARVPRSLILNPWIIFGVSHSHSPPDQQ
jgi:hypothetical protein